MNIKVDKSQTIISLEFTPKEYFLCKSEDDSLGEYSLNYRIDRSYAGKSDDIGVPRLYLTREEAEIFRNNGFIEIK